MGILDLRGIKDFVTGEARKRAEEAAERERIEEVDDIKLAGNPDLSKAECLRLANSPYPFVRIALAHNRKVPDSVIKVLAKDPNPIVSGKAQEALSAKLEQEGINPSFFIFADFILPTGKTGDIF